MLKYASLKPAVTDTIKTVTAVSKSMSGYDAQVTQMQRFAQSRIQDQNYQKMFNSIDFSDEDIFVTYDRIFKKKIEGILHECEKDIKKFLNKNSLELDKNDFDPSLGEEYKYLMMRLTESRTYYWMMMYQKILQLQKRNVNTNNTQFYQGMKPQSKIFTNKYLMTMRCTKNGRTYTTHLEFKTDKKVICDDDKEVHELMHNVHERLKQHIDLLVDVKERKLSYALKADLDQSQLDMVRENERIKSVQDLYDLIQEMQNKTIPYAQIDTTAILGKKMHSDLDDSNPYHGDVTYNAPESKIFQKGNQNANGKYTELVRYYNTCAYRRMCNTLLENEYTAQWFNNTIAKFIRWSRINVVTENASYDIEIRNWNGMDSTYIKPFLAVPSLFADRDYDFRDIKEIRNNQDTPHPQNYYGYFYQGLNDYSISGRASETDLMMQTVNNSLIIPDFFKSEWSKFYTQEIEQMIQNGTTLFPLARVYYSSEDNAAGDTRIYFMECNKVIIGVYAYAPSIRYLYTQNENRLPKPRWTPRVAGPPRSVYMPAQHNYGGNSAQHQYGNMPAPHGSAYPPMPKQHNARNFVQRRSGERRRSWTVQVDNNAIQMFRAFRAQVFMHNVTELNGSKFKSPNKITVNNLLFSKKDKTGVTRTLDLICADGPIYADPNGFFYIRPLYNIKVDRTTFPRTWGLISLYVDQSNTTKEHLIAVKYENPESLLEGTKWHFLTYVKEPSEMINNFHNLQIDSASQEETDRLHMMSAEQWNWIPGYISKEIRFIADLMITRQEEVKAETQAHKASQAQTQAPSQAQGGRRGQPSNAPMLPPNPRRLAVRPSPAPWQEPETTAQLRSLESGLAEIKRALNGLKIFGAA